MPLLLRKSMALINRYECATACTVHRHLIMKIESLYRLLLKHQHSKLQYSKSAAIVAGRISTKYNKYIIILKNNDKF